MLYGSFKIIQIRLILTRYKSIVTFCVRWNQPTLVLVCIIKMLRFKSYQVSWVCITIGFNKCLLCHIVLSSFFKDGPKWVGSAIDSLYLCCQSVKRNHIFWEDRVGDCSAICIFNSISLKLRVGSCLQKQVHNKLQYKDPS